MCCMQQLLANSSQEPSALPRLSRSMLLRGACDLLRLLTKLSGQGQRAHRVSETLTWFAGISGVTLHPPDAHIMYSLPSLKAPYLPWGKSAHRVMMQGHRLSDASFMQTTCKRGPHAQRWQEAGTVGCKGIPNLIKKDKHQPCKSKPPGPPSACLLLTLYCKANEESRDISE